jgi:hypothetical protein
MRYEMHTNYNFLKCHTFSCFSHDKKLSFLVGFGRLYQEKPYYVALAYRRNGLNSIDFNLVLASKVISTYARLVEILVKSLET